MKQKKFTSQLSLAIMTCLVTFCCFTSCKKDEPNSHTNSNNSNQNTTSISLEDTISRNWEVIAATHNGTSDQSSVGLKLNILKDGTYLLITSGYKGTWEFIEQKSKVLLDKNTPSYKTTWTIVNMNSKTMYITFKSPFTGGNASWTLKSY